MDTTGANNAMYALRDIPGKGKGLVATRTIPKGTRILSEQPLIAVPFGKSEKWRGKFITQKVKALKKKQRDAFLSMPNEFRFIDTTTRYIGIFETNSLPADDELGKKNAIFPEALLINHDCDDNAVKMWNENIKRHTVHAMRDIHAGEEITLSYEPYYNNRQTRQKSLRENFGFTCFCRACSLPDEQSEERDRKLDQIRSLIQRYNEPPCSCTSCPDFTLLTYLDGRVSIYRDLDREDWNTASTYAEAVSLTIARSDLARGRVFAQKAAAIWTTILGSDSTRAIKYADLARDPSTHEKYGTSSVWRTAVSEVPQGLGPDDFDNWLWRREKPKAVVPKVMLPPTQAFFSAFSDLPRNTDFCSDGSSKERRHWCFLGEILEPVFILPFDLEVVDIHNKKTKVHFYTEGAGTEIDANQHKPGHTVAIIDATRYDFKFGPPGIRHKDPRMIKVFPLRLATILSMSSEVHRLSMPQDNDMRTCHGCGNDAAAASMKRCTGCWSLWYCNKDCQKVGWTLKFHKFNCKALSDPDLRRLFLTEWEKVQDSVSFPLKVSDD
ncbi:hypothetical protein E4U09_003566 [Claviceps aff. purpurea]|uniref:Suppressor of anucleate metulae protein B n=1 Tax=Claviceps aff. purpurea TaxID=1967640 RepID=A0A9P7TXU5_9HYPO|nr:hypothetical protein E4U09_003566 [Claviceps aff. purpurea]